MSSQTPRLIRATKSRLPAQAQIVSTLQHYCAFISTAPNVTPTRTMTTSHHRIQTMMLSSPSTTHDAIFSNTKPFHSVEGITSQQINSKTIPLTTCRKFSSRSGGGGKFNKKNKGNTKDNNVPVNEELIGLLLRKNKPNNAASIEVRLILDKGRDESPEVNLMPLTEAIVIASDHAVDLVGVNIKGNSTPVLKAVDYKKMLYHENKKNDNVNGSSKKKNAANKKKVTKEFSFKAGIDNHDLDRKVNNMISYLVKGHSCQVTITSNRRKLMEDKNVVVTTLNRVREVVGDNGTVHGQLKKNAYGNRGSLMFQPAAKKK